MSCALIENFEELLLENVGFNQTISINSIRDLTPPGENYCSNIFKVDITVQNLDNTAETTQLKLVAKIIKRGFNVPIIEIAKIFFRKEIAFYTEISPCLRDFQLEQEFGELKDIYPEMVAFRKNLNDSDGPLDENVVIVLENLEPKGEF